MAKYKPGMLVTVDNKVYRITKFPKNAKEKFRYRIQPCVYCRKMCSKNPENWAWICCRMRGGYPKLVK